MKKVLVVVLAVLLMMSSFLLAGCETEKATDTKESAITAKPASSEKEEMKEDITITVMAPQDQIKPIEEEVIAKEFEAETGIKVIFNIVPSDQYDNLLSTKLNSGQGVDIFLGQSGSLNIGPRFNPEKNCVDLSNEEWVSRVEPTSLASTMLNGKVYGLQVWNVSQVWSVVYNKTIFNDLGLEVPTTYAEFIAVCDAIKAAGITPMYECVSDGWHHVLGFAELGVALDPSIYDKLNKNEVKLAEIPELVTLLEQMNEVAQNYSGKNYLANEFVNGTAELSEGNYAMMINRITMAQEIEAAFPDGKYTADDFGSFVIPYLDNQVVNINPQGPTRFIFATSENIEASKKYLEYLARPEVLQQFIDNEPAFTALPFEGVTFNQTEQQKEFFATYTTTGTVLQAGVAYIDPQWMDIGKELTAMYTGQKTPLEVLESIDKSRADQAEAIGDPYWD